MLSYIFLGIVQGIFEWIPISSEGIVALCSNFLLKDINPVDIALFLHLGTLFAVLVYFRKDWKEILTLRNPRLLRFLVLTTFISLVVGYPLYKLIREVAIGSGIMIVMGFGLLFTAYFNKFKKFSGIGFNKLAIVTGFLQGLSVIPGLSRSGSTIFGLSLGENNPSQILKISYIISAPVVLASSAYLFLENPSLVYSSLLSLIFSFLTGFLTLKFLFKIAGKINFFGFALIFSLLCFLGAAIGFII